MTPLFLIWIIPMVISYFICRDRNRSVAKGLFVTFFLGWFATILLWLGLKYRDPVSLMLR